MSGECFLFAVLLFAQVLIFFELLHKAIHAQENKEAARKKVAVAEELRNMKLKEAAKNVSESEEETLTYIDFPSRYWLDIHTNNVIERLNREIRSRMRVERIQLKTKLTPLQKRRQVE